MKLVLSDLHFGLEANSSFQNEDTIKKFKQEIEKEIENRNVELEEIILLGDVFDFWRATPDKAIAASKPFFKSISEFNTDIVFVVGNHDHHLVIMDHEAKFMNNLERTGETQKTIFSSQLELNNFLDNICPVKSVKIKYPYHIKKIDGKCFVFQHGHHLDFFQTLMPSMMTSLSSFLETIFSKLTGKKSVENVYYPRQEKFETIMSHTYENLYQSAFVGEYVKLENGFWTIPKTMGTLWGNVCKTLRYTPVSRQYESILKFVRKYYENNNVSCFVYGDTHKAGGYFGDGTLLAVNSGCWIDEPNKDAWRKA
ncbi:MAG: hypothetical protein FJ150_09485 [Euryarchaeota archaeon]|nr:hypothetical protein [Euryarchaeota archaeon]